MDAATTTKRVGRTLDAGVTNAALNAPGTSRRSKRIAIVASYAPSLLIFRGPLIRRLKTLGHDVVCVAPEIDRTTRRKLEELGAEIHEIPLQRNGVNPLADVDTMLSLRRLFQNERPDIVLSYTAKPAIYGSIAARLANVSRIVPMLTGLGAVYLDDVSVKNRLLRPIMNMLYRVAFSGADAIIFHNKDDRAYLSSLRALPEQRPTYVVNGSGVDLEQFSFQPLPDTTNGLNFLMISRLIRGKGIEEYCQAARALKAEWPNSRWRLLGPEDPGSMGLSLKDLRAYEDCVDYLGPANDVRPALNACHVYVLPSYGEGMPRTILEALATGRPVITTDATGCRETVTPGLNGILIPPRNYKALAAAMQRLLQTPNHLEAMATESHRIARQDFDVNRVNDKMIQALGISLART
ncbi:MAG: glycosyltransferase family 4 protein [Methyloligellaceae bacterium]